MADTFTRPFVEGLVQLVESRRNETRAAAMARYMKDQFAFAGIPSPGLAAILREALSGLPPPTEAETTDALARLWALPEREFQYAGCALVRREAKHYSPAFVAVLHGVVTTKSWWDTVDSLAANGAGPLVLRHPELVSVMDEWIESENLWLARTALLHQLRFRERTDRERLFRYCRLRAPDTEFFIRKAIGWALREYSRIAPAEVVAFVRQHSDELSPLSRREALKWLTVRASGRRVAAEAGILPADLA
jgi:3-methyladenine DNA glycosylase AlkD